MVVSSLSLGTWCFRLLSPTVVTFSLDSFFIHFVAPSKYSTSTCLSFLLFFSSSNVSRTFSRSFSAWLLPFIYLSLFPLVCLNKFRRFIKVLKISLRRSVDMGYFKVNNLLILLVCFHLSTGHSIRLCIIQNFLVSSKVSASTFS